MLFKKQYFYYLLFAVILFPVLCFPLSSDHVIFILAGKLMNEGGSLYAEFIDIKPPLIYAVFALLYKIFGFSEFQYRIFDFVWQLATTFSLVFVVKRILNNEQIAISSGIIYSLLYTTLHYSQTMHTETLMFLPLIWMTYLYFNKKNNFTFVLIGVLAGLITGFKFTFGVILLVLLLHIALTYRKSKFSNILKVVLGSIIGFVITVIPILNKDSFIAFSHIWSYIIDYSSLNASTDFLAYLIKSTGNFLGDKLSNILSFLTVYGIIAHFITPWKSYKKTNFSSFVILLFFGLFFTVLLEGKLTPYHFSRLYLPISILSATAFIFLYSLVKRSLRHPKTMSKVLMVCLMGFILLFSPIPRWIAILQPTATYFYDSETFNSLYSEEGSTELVRLNQMKVSAYLNDNSDLRDMLVLSAIGSNQIYLYSGLTNFSKFGQSQFYLGKYVKDNWIKDFIIELKTTDWLVIQDNDSHSSITGYLKSSLELIKSNSEFNKILEDRFILQETFGPYLIFESKD